MKHDVGCVFALVYAPVIVQAQAAMDWTEAAERTTNVSLAQFGGPPIMPVEVDLQPAGQPGRHAHVAQAQFLVEEVEIVMQAFVVVGLQEGSPRRFVVPRLVSRAGLHDREDMPQTGVIAAPALP